MKTRIIRAKLLIDGTGRDPIPNGVIVIENERIKAVGRSGQVELPNDAEMIDLRDQTVLPGLVDAHSHNVLTQEKRTLAQQNSDPLPRMVLRAANNVLTDLLSGVTTIRTLGDPQHVDVMLRDAINSGDVPGPRLLVSDQVLRSTHGPGLMLGPHSDGIAAVQHQVRDSIFHGADVIKIFATGWLTEDPALYQIHQFTDTAPFSRDEIHAIIEEAHRVGLKVTAHAHGGQGLRDCIESGIDTIEHATFMDDAMIELFLKHGTRLVGTNTVLLDPELGLMAKKDFQTDPVYRSEILYAQENVRRMHPKAYAAGIKFSMGTDGRHGYYARELLHVNKMGVSPAQAIVAATRTAAEILGIDDKVGTLEPGKFADVISVKGNPTEDISILGSVEMVMKDGKRYDHLRAQKSQDL